MKNLYLHHTIRLSIAVATLVGMMMLLSAKPALAHPGHEAVFLQNLAKQSLTPTVILTGLGIAFLFGASHALAPGHGKTMVAAYLVGSRGTPQHALLLGLVTTITHTLGVFALGILALLASQYILPEQLYPILSLISGLTVCGVGFWLLDSRLHNSSHDHDNKVNHEHQHHHSIPEEPVTLKSLIALGIAGGMVPCPSALVLLLSAIALHRAAYGILLLGAFSLGLASVLIAIGLVAVYACKWLERLPTSSTLQQHLPVASAIAIIVAGAVLTGYAVI
ncbi:MAG: sulfite exporter TauE/SafE family protein [Stigonema ocellatum SAG 48.90 = DSM 106950]|nr:sulfite exporter TauE/SafE family protein [Stigonema ocellatum SAG 48.90 = DSM 106950]